MAYGLLSLLDIFAFTVLGLLFGYFVYIVYYTLDLFFLNPFRHIPSISKKEEDTIARNLHFYRKLSEAKKRRFNKRVARFRHRKKIDFHEAVEEREKIRLLLSATAVMLTLGMADFLILSIKKILVYPSRYYSPFTRKDHHGEYNPGFKTLVFSAEQLLEGFRIPNDNRNLAVHEFAHAISFNVANKLNIRSYIFLFGMKRIERLFSNADFIKKVDRKKYFRPYGKTNVHEFFAVAVENYIETPQRFRKEFPKLFKTITNMLNLKFYSASSRN